MIRLVQRKLIIPRGDTGTFSVPVLSADRAGDVAVFTIFDKMTQRKIYSKLINSEKGVFNIRFNHSDTVNLPAGKYYWDIKFYQNPVFVDDELVDGQEIDSYYAAFSIPECEIRETGDVMLAADDAPNALLEPNQLNIVNGALSAIQEGVSRAQAAAEQAERKADEIQEYNYTLTDDDYNEIASRIDIPVPQGNINDAIGNYNEEGIADRYYYPYEFILMNNKVYRITTDIRQGQRFIPGTNCRETFILEQLGNLYAYLFGE